MVGKGSEKMKGYQTSLLLVGPVNWHTAQFGSWGWVGMLQTMALGLSKSIEIDERPGQIFKQGSVEVPTAAGGRENKQQIPLIAHSMGEGKLVPYMGWG